ncbi:MAG: hypothetical protein WC503_05025 [Candidatus Shapirobacteria bacterium]
MNQKEITQGLLTPTLEAMPINRLHSGEAKSLMNFTLVPLKERTSVK